MTTTNHDRAYAVRGLIALMLMGEERVLHQGTRPEREAAKIRVDLLLELLMFTDECIPAEWRRPNVMDPPTPREIHQARDGVARLFSALAMVGEPGVVPHDTRVQQARDSRKTWLAGLAAIGETFDPLAVLTTVFAQLDLAPPPGLSVGPTHH